MGGLQDLQVDCTVLGLVLITAAAGIIPSIILFLSQRADRRMQQQRDTWNYYRDALSRLVELRGVLQFLHYVPPNEMVSAKIREREDAYGEAYGIMLSLADPELLECANIVIEPLANPSEKLEGINSAIVLIGKRVKGFTQGKRS